MRSRSQFFSLLLPAAVGIALGFAEVYVLGFVAARPYPHWYLLVLQDHRHLRYELWGVIGVAAPIALLAAACGAALARIGKTNSIAAPVVAVAAWLLCRSFLVPIVYDEPVSALGEAIHYFPVSMIAGMVLPAVALFFAYRRMTRTR